MASTGSPATTTLVPLALPAVEPPSSAVGWRWDVDTEQWVVLEDSSWSLSALPISSLGMDGDSDPTAAIAEVRTDPEVLAAYASHTVTKSSSSSVHYTFTAVGHAHHLALTRVGGGIAAAPRVVHFFLPLDDVVRTAVHVLPKSSAAPDVDSSATTTMIRLTLVQTTGTLWYWDVCFPETGNDNATTSCAPLQSCFLPDLFSPYGQQQQSQQLQNTTDPAHSSLWLRRSAVVPLSPDVWLVAWTPWLLAVDMVQRQVAVWSASVTAERSGGTGTGPTLTRLFQAGLSYLAGDPTTMIMTPGKSGRSMMGMGTSSGMTMMSDYLVQDMSAILTLATVAIDDDDSNVDNNRKAQPLYVYSWHDDGILRRWTFWTSKTASATTARSSLQPTAVSEHALVATEALPAFLLEGSLVLGHVHVDKGRDDDGSYRTAGSNSTHSHVVAFSATTGDDRTMYIVTWSNDNANHSNDDMAADDSVVGVHVQRIPSPQDALALTGWQWCRCSGDNAVHSHHQLRVLWEISSSSSSPESGVHFSGSAGSYYEEFVYQATDGALQSRTLWTPPTPPVVEYDQLSHGQSGDRDDEVEEDDEDEETVRKSPSDALHAVDEFYLAHLLRPIRIRPTTGTMLPPTPDLIREALYEVTKTRPHVSQSLSSPSIGVQVIIAVHAWRQALATTTPGRPHYQPLYTSPHLSPASPTRETVTQVVRDHIACWKKLLQKIYRLEEGTTRTILHVHWTMTPQGATGLLLRGQGDTAVVPPTQPPPVVEEGVVGLLDNTAVRVLASLQDDPAAAQALVSLEDKMERDLRSGQLALTPVATLNQLKVGLNDLGQEGNSQPFWNKTVLPPEESVELMQADWTGHMEALQLFPWGYALPGLTLLRKEDEGKENSTMEAAPIEEDFALSDNIHWRLSALSLTMTSLDSYRRLMLGRYMVLNYLGLSPEVTNVALWGYLQSLSLLMTCAQHVQLPLQLFPVRPIPAPAAPNQGTSPPTKRPSIDSQVPSFLENKWSIPGKATALDAYLMSVVGKAGSTFLRESSNLSSFACLASEVVLRGLFGSSEPETTLPELDILRSSTHVSPLEFPRAAMWLLSAAYSVKTDAWEHRVSALARCLLRLAEDETDPNLGKAMAERAFYLMRFDPHQVDVCVNRIITLHSYVGSQSRFSEKVLLLVEQAVHECKSLYPPEIWTKDNYGTLLSMYFSAAVGVRHWKTAFSAALIQPDPCARSECLRRLVRNMVDNGALAELVKVCALPSEPLSDARLNGIDMYATAVATLSGMTQHDSYAQALASREPLSDYQGALFCLHVANKEWKRAAEALDQRFNHARDALIKGSKEVTGEQVRQREELIVQDLVISSMGRAFVMHLLDNPNDAYIVSGEMAMYPTLPLRLLNDMSTNRFKRLHDWLQGTPSEATTELNGKETNLLDRFLRRVDVDLVAVRSICFQVLHTADKVGPAQVEEYFGGGAAQVQDKALIHELLVHGFYEYGIMLGKAYASSRNVEKHGAGEFEHVVTCLACDFLVPIATGKNDFAAPSPPRLIEILCAFAPGELPCLPSIAKPIKNADASSYLVRQLAGEILRHITMAYTTCAAPLAVNVADAFISKGEHGPCPVPEWLHSLLVHGTPSDEPPVPGLFAKRSNGKLRFNGNPSFLLSAYTKQGMYEEACRVVTETLAVANQGQSATNRLPERGDIDFVPYDKIDLLYNLMTLSVDRGLCSVVRAVHLSRAKQTLEDCLKRHFELLQVSEEGLKSARALSNG